MQQPGEAEDRLRERSAACETRERETFRAVKEGYLRLREECLGTAKQLDGEWQRFLCSFGDRAPEEEQALPEDLPDRLGELAACFAELEADDEGK